MSYIESILWFITWPMVIYIAFKFVHHNLKHYHRLERLEMYEKKYGDIVDFDD